MVACNESHGREALTGGFMAHSMVLFFLKGASVLLGLSVILACDSSQSPKAEVVIPESYAAKHMPQDWWNNQKIIDAGRQIYLGDGKTQVNCSKCHGKTGEGIRSGAGYFRNTETMKTYSDSYLFWRISEGVPYTAMAAFKNKLSEDEIWQVIAFISSLGLDGLKYDPTEQAWIPAG